MTSFHELIATGPVLFDGAMGTVLAARGLTPEENPALWCVERPEEILDVHRAYVDAGCQAITTNSFAANPIYLERFGLAPRADTLVRSAVRLAHEASAGRALVFGDVGPMGELLHPFGPVNARDAQAAYHTVMEAFVMEGVDGVILETMADPEEAGIAIRIARNFGSWPIVATFAFQHGPRGLQTAVGAAPREVADVAREAGADAIGVNCGTDLSPDDYLTLADAFASVAGDLPVVVQPNAGTPRLVEGETVYEHGPEEIAQLLSRLVAAGVRIVGGCCGTTPEALARAARGLEELRRSA